MLEARHGRRTLRTSPAHQRGILTADVSCSAFTKRNHADCRHLELWASDAGMHVENHIPKLHDRVRLWLQSDNNNDKVEWFD